MMVETVFCKIVNKVPKVVISVVGLPAIETFITSIIILFCLVISLIFLTIINDSFFKIYKYGEFVTLNESSW